MTRNSTKATNPQYRYHEDIVFCSFSHEKTYEYLSEVSVEYPLLRNRKNIDKLGDGDRFAVGYPDCFHYDKEPLIEEGHDLFKSSRIPLSLLIITRGCREFTVRNESILIKAPTYKSMSGGPVLKVDLAANVINEDEKIQTLKISPVIKFIGCIAYCDDNEEIYCF